jgi:hypothetical protein
VAPHDGILTDSLISGHLLQIKVVTGDTPLSIGIDEVD